MRTIWKFTLELRDRQDVMMPARARVLSVQMQQGALQLWALCDPTAPYELRRIAIVGTGHAAPEDGEYLGTVQMMGAGKSFVWHFFMGPNDRVEGRDAALSRRVPSHDGLCHTGDK